MDYSMTTPCKDCPFLAKFRRAFPIKRLEQFASGEFACHKTCAVEEDEEGGGSSYKPQPGSTHCAGALIYLEKRNRSHQMMRVCERLRLYDHTKLDMGAKVR